MFKICVCLGLKGLRSIPICPRGRGSRGRGDPRHPRTGESPIIYPNVTLLGQYYILPFGPTRPNQTRTSLLNCLKGNSAALQNLIMETTISYHSYNMGLLCNSLQNGCLEFLRSFQYSVLHAFRKGQTLDPREKPATRFDWKKAMMHMNIVGS
eukprot:scaffold16649_cov204-Skeletonema_marinoi.AAC.2